MNPALVLCPTRAMAEDIAGLGIPVDVFYHHFDPRLGTIPPNTGRKKIVLYHGAPTLGLMEASASRFQFSEQCKIHRDERCLAPACQCARSRARWATYRLDHKAMEIEYQSSDCVAFGSSARRVARSFLS